MRWIELVAISNAELTAAPRNETKKTSRWNGVTLGQPRANGTASRNAKSTCTPGSATRSSLRSSISSRSCRSFGLSSRFSTLPKIVVYPLDRRHARPCPCRHPARSPRGPRPLSEPDGPADADRPYVHLVRAGELAREGRGEQRAGADARAQHRRVRLPRDGHAARDR